MIPAFMRPTASARRNRAGPRLQFLLQIFFRALLGESAGVCRRTRLIHHDGELALDTVS